MFEDWTVDVVSVVPVPNTAKNPYTGVEIDPDGITQSLFVMRLTHVPTGKILERADRIGTPSAEALRRYAQGIITTAEQNMAAQNGALVGMLPVVPPPKVDTRTQAEKDREAFRQADALYEREAAELAKLIEADPKSTAALQAKVDALKQARDLAAKIAAESTAAEAVG